MLMWTNTYNDEEPKASRQVTIIMDSDLGCPWSRAPLYTSILPNIMIPDIGKTLCETEAQVVLYLQHHDPAW